MGDLTTTANQVFSGTADAWKRLVEELARMGEGKFLVTMNGRRPVSLSRIAAPYRLTERDEVGKHE